MKNMKDLKAKMPSAIHRNTQSQWLPKLRKIKNLKDSRPKMFLLTKKFLWLMMRKMELCWT